jgi:hypothetical protein
MLETDFFSRLIELRDEMRDALAKTDGKDQHRDELTQARLNDVEQLIAQWVSPRN